MRNKSPLTAHPVFQKVYAGLAVATITGIGGLVWKFWGQIKKFGFFEYILAGFALLLIAGLFWGVWFWFSSPKHGKAYEGGDLNIRGKWETRFEENGKIYNEKISIDQKENNVSGLIELLDFDDPSTVTDRYDFDGIFKDRVLTGTYEATDSSDYERGAFTLIYEKKKFKGQYIFFSTENDREKIVTSKYEWKRLT